MAPPTPRAVVPLDSFAQHLDKTFSAIVETVQGSLSATQHPVPVNADWLANQMRHVFTNNYLVVSNYSSTSSLELTNAEAKLVSGLGILIRLPREIRDIVFSIAIAGGNVAFTRASKILSLETSDLLIKDGVCRTYIGYEGTGVAKQYPAFNPIQNIADRVQNLHIHVWVDGHFFGPKTKLKSLMRFAGSNVQRKHCRIDFVSRLYHSAPMVSREVLKVVEHFTGFEEVVVELLHSYDPKWIDNLDPFTANRLSLQRLNQCGLVDEVLEAKLGKGSWRRDRYIAEMTYRPRDRGSAEQESGNTDLKVSDSEEEHEEDEGDEDDGWKDENGDWIL